MAPSVKDIIASDKSDYDYVSIKNWLRKQKIVKDGDQISSLIGRPGPITGLVLSLVDMILTLILKLTFNVFSICTYAFMWIYNMIFGNFKALIPISVIGGSVVSMKFFRYTLTVLMPPFGVLISKGLYGWFNVAVCMLITYINFIAGIVYAFIITARNRYADQYEAREMNNALQENTPLLDIDVDTNAFWGTLGVLVVLIILIFIFIYVF